MRDWQNEAQGRTGTRGRIPSRRSLSPVGRGWGKGRWKRIRARPGLGDGVAGAEGEQRRLAEEGSREMRHPSRPVVGRRAPRRVPRCQGEERRFLSFKDRCECNRRPTVVCGANRSAIPRLREGEKRAGRRRDARVVLLRTLAESVGRERQSTSGRHVGTVADGRRHSPVMVCVRAGQRFGRMAFYAQLYVIHGNPHAQTLHPPYPPLPLPSPHLRKVREGKEEARAATDHPQSHASGFRGAEDVRSWEECRYCGAAAPYRRPTRPLRHFGTGRVTRGVALPESVTTGDKYDCPGARAWLRTIRGPQRRAAPLARRQAAA